MDLYLEVEERVFEKVKLIGGILLINLLITSLVFLILFFELLVLFTLHHSLKLIPIAAAKLANNELR